MKLTVCTIVDDKMSIRNMQNSVKRRALKNKLKLLFEILFVFLLVFHFYGLYIFFAYISFYTFSIIKSEFFACFWFRNFGTELYVLW